MLLTRWKQTDASLRSIFWNFTIMVIGGWECGSDVIIYVWRFFVRSFTRNRWWWLISWCPKKQELLSELPGIFWWQFKCIFHTYIQKNNIKIQLKICNVVFYMTQFVAKDLLMARKDQCVSKSKRITTGIAWLLNVQTKSPNLSHATNNLIAQHRSSYL